MINNSTQEICDLKSNLITSYDRMCNLSDDAPQKECSEYREAVLLLRGVSCECTQVASTSGNYNITDILTGNTKKEEKRCAWVGITNGMD